MLCIAQDAIVNRADPLSRVPKKPKKEHHTPDGRFIDDIYSALSMGVSRDCDLSFDLNVSENLANYLYYCTSGENSKNDLSSLDWTICPAIPWLDLTQLWLRVL